MSSTLVKLFYWTWAHDWWAAIDLDLWIAKPLLWFSLNWAPTEILWKLDVRILINQIIDEPVIINLIVVNNLFVLRSESLLIMLFFGTW